MCPQDPVEEAGEGAFVCVGGEWPRDPGSSFSRRMAISGFGHSSGICSQAMGWDYRWAASVALPACQCLSSACSHYGIATSPGTVGTKYLMSGCLSSPTSPTTRPSAARAVRLDCGASSSSRVCTVWWTVLPDHCIPVPDDICRRQDAHSSRYRSHVPRARTPRRPGPSPAVPAPARSQFLSPTSPGSLQPVTEPSAPKHAHSSIGKQTRLSPVVGCLGCASQPSQAHPRPRQQSPPIPGLPGPSSRTPDQLAAHYVVSPCLLPFTCESAKPPSPPS